MADVTFLKGTGTLPSTKTEGTLYFDTQKGAIYLDKNSSSRVMFCNCNDTPFLSGNNTFTGDNYFNEPIEGNLLGNATTATTANKATAANLISTTSNSLVKFSNNQGTFSDSHAVENELTGNTYSYSFANGYALGKNSIAIGENTFAFGENSFSNTPENFSSGATYWILNEYLHDAQDPDEDGYHWYGPVEGGSDPNFAINDYVNDPNDNSSKIKKVIAKTTWSEDHSTPIYAFDIDLSSTTYCPVYNISKGAFGNNSISIGQNNTVKGNYSLAFGENLITTNDYEIALGKYNNSNSTSPKSLFSIGNGNNISRNNLVSISEDGNIKIDGKISIIKDQTLSSSSQELFSTKINNKKLAIEAVKYSTSSYSTNPIFKINAIATGSSNDLVLQSKQLFIEIDGQIYKAVITGGAQNPGGIGSTLKFEYIASNA